MEKRYFTTSGTLYKVENSNKDFDNSSVFTKQSKKQLLKNYLLENIDFTGYDNLENTIANVYNTCLSEYGHVKNDYKRVKEWLLGLPSCLSIVFSYYDISQIMTSFGYKTKDVYKLNDMYWNMLTKIIVENK